MLNTLNEYAQLVNFALFIAIVGWLFQITQSYKTASQEKYDAIVAAKNEELAALSERLRIEEKKYEAALELKEELVTTLRGRLELDVERHNASLAAKDQQLKALEQRLELEGIRHRNKTGFLETELSLFKQLFTLSGDKALEALREDMESRIEALKQQKETDSEFSEQSKHELETLQRSQDRIQKAYEMARKIALDQNSVALLVRAIAPLMHP